MAYHQYGQDILVDVLFTGGESVTLSGGQTSDYLTYVKHYLQRRYHDLVMAEPWWWALKDPPGIISTSAEVTGTATCTEGSATVTLGATVAASMTGRWFKIDNENIPYRIASHTGGSATVTLDATYKEDSVTSGAYTIWQDEYDLASDCVRMWRAWNRNNPKDEIEIITDHQMHIRHTNPTLSRTSAIVIAPIRGSKIRIHPYTTDAKTIEYEYTARVSDLTWDQNASTDVPVIPLESRSVLVDLGLNLLYHVKNDPRSVDEVEFFMVKVAQMKKIYLNQGNPRAYARYGGGIAG